MLLVDAHREHTCKELPCAYGKRMHHMIGNSIFCKVPNGKKNCLHIYTCMHIGYLQRCGLCQFDGAYCQSPTHLAYCQAPYPIPYIVHSPGGGGGRGYEHLNRAIVLRTSDGFCPLFFMMFTSHPLISTFYQKICRF